MPMNIRERRAALTARLTAIDEAEAAREDRSVSLTASESRRFDRETRDSRRDIMAELGELDELPGESRISDISRELENRQYGRAGLDLTERRLSTPLLTREQRIADWTRQNDPRAYAEPDVEDVRLGALLQTWITGRRNNLNEAEHRAMNEGVGTAGGLFVPTPTASYFIDRARNSARVVQAGATSVPMDSQTLRVPRLTGSSTPAWRNENAAIASGDLTVDAVTLTAKSLAFIVTVSRELIEDSNPAILQVVENDLSAQVGLEIDRVALRGTGTAPEPRGIRNTSGVTVTAFGGANGATPTNYDHLIDAVQSVRASNFEPNAMIQSPRSETTLAKLKETSTLAYLQPPAALDNIPRLLSNQIPGNLTVGTSTDTTEVYAGQWPLLYLGIRTGPMTIQLVERYADLGQIALLIWFRGDIALAQPAAFSVTTGVRP